MDDLKSWWPVIAALAAFAANYGLLRGTLTAFRREVDEMKKALDAVNGVDKRLVAVETEVNGILDRTMPALSAEVARNHESARAVHAQIRVEISQSVADLRREMSNNVMSSHPGNVK